MLVTICILLTIVVVGLLIALNIKCDQLEMYKVEYESWRLKADRYQDHFWRLVNSPVVDKNKWEIRLPWAEVGVEDSIRPKNNNKA